MNKGFTLIEIMVSVAVFATVMTLSLGALLAMTESNRKVETMKSVINTLNFALDAMSRSIRTGSQYHCGTPAGGDCPSGGTYINFTTAEGDLIEYRHMGGAIERQTTLEGGSASGWLPLTSKEVVIETLRFHVVGSSISDEIQPKASIVLAGYVVVSGGGASAAACGTTAQCSRFELQTSVTQRIYDQ